MPELKPPIVTFEIILHPRSRDDSVSETKSRRSSGPWCRKRQSAVSYAEWLGREVETAEIRVYNRDGSLADSRVIRRAGQPEQSN